jgi:hypothetical protein
MTQQGKAEIEMVENSTTVEDLPAMDSKGGAPLMRSKADDLSVWQSVRLYKRVGFIAMAAAFCASLDGYRKAFLTCQSADENARADRVH